MPRHANQDRPDTTSSEKRSITETTASSDADEEGSETTSIKTSRPVRTAAASETIAETQLIDSSPGANNVAGTTRVGPARPSAPKVGTQAAADTAKIQVSVPGNDGFSVANIDTQRVRDYVAAFVLAGLDPHVASEADFFADRVRYYDAGIKDRDAIRRDLQSYNRRWPHRTFWLPGEIKIEPQSDNQVRVTFPLRFELQNGETKSRGQVEKDIVLRPAGDDFEIVAVNEREVN